MNSSDAEKGTILIVDDLPANLNLLRSVLEPEGFRILGSTSGAGALGILKHARPDAILLDVTMPGMDGFETCRQIKAIEELKSVPVVFITARHETEAIVEGFKSGGEDYLTKPFNRQEIIVRVQSHVEKSRLRFLLSERNRELEKLNLELKEAMANIKTLRGLIPICSFCHKIRDDKGYWEAVETYLQRHSDASLTHGICPDCQKKNFPDI